VVACACGEVRRLAPGRSSRTAAPSAYPAHVGAGDLQRFPDDGRDRVVDRYACLALERFRERRAAKVGAQDRDRLRPAARDVAHHLRDLVRARLGEGEVVALAEVPLGDALDAGGGVVLHDRRLDIVDVRGHEAEARHAGAPEDLVEGEYRRARRHAGRRGDPLAQALVGIEAQPARRGSVPADHVELRVGEQFRGAEDLAVVELPERLVCERDLGDAEPPEMGAHLRQTGEHLRGHRLEHGIRGRRQHPQEQASGHGRLVTKLLTIVCTISHHLVNNYSRLRGGAPPRTRRSPCLDAPAPTKSTTGSLRRSSSTGWPREPSSERSARRDLRRQSRAHPRDPRRLAHEQIVRLEPNRGAFVAAPSPEEAREIFESRRLIEPGIMRRLVRTIDRKGIERLRTLVREEAQARAVNDRSAIIRLSGEFHIVMAQLAGNRFLTKALRELASLTCLIIFLYDSPSIPSCHGDEHAEIVDAIARKDAERAVKLMLHHLDHVEASLALQQAPPAALALEQVFA
jgi:DNA-binding GntR family transcriptional regulator